MRTSIAPKYTWSDAQLIDAIKRSACWRDVVRALGLTTTSEGVMRRVRRDAARLCLDVSHFKATRTWDDAQLKRAVADGRSWDDVFTSLGLRTPTKGTRVRVTGHAMRLGLNISHLNEKSEKVPASSSWRIDLIRLRDAALPVAAAWFTIRGCTVSLPIEQAVYDLLVHSADGICRVQVKTTTTKGSDRGQVTVSRRPYSVGNLSRRLPYDPQVIDYFFIVDGDYDMYLIPSRVVAGRVVVQLRTYRRYVVGNASGLLGADAEMAEAGCGASA
jgi:hypothetical protein